MNALPRLGVDFGTSHTVAVCQWREGAGQPLLFDASPLLPSAVLADGQRRLLVGRDAQRGARSDPAGFEPYPKRRIDDGAILLGGGDVGVADMIGAVLSRCTGEAARVAASPPAEVVLTHPAVWGPRRRSVLTEAAARAGIEAPLLVAEPTAAAVYFTSVLGVRVPPGGAVVVYDLGAGTFDVAVVRREGDTGWAVLACDGFDDVGGVEFDALIVEGLRDRFRDRDPRIWQRLTRPETAADVRARATLWEEARAAKEQLSRNSTAGVHVPLYDAEVHVTRDEFERAARPLVERTVAKTASTLSRSGLRPGEAVGLFLVGGSTRIPLVATQLHRRLGIAPTVIEQPELVVAQGAVIAAASVPAPSPARSTVEPPASRGAAAWLPPPPPASTPGPPPRPRRRRLRIAGVAAATALVLAAGAVLYLLANRERESELTALGQRNAAVFRSVELAAFARPWLNDVSRCEQATPDTYGGTATEYVNCTGSSWRVHFRAMRNTAARDKSRQNRALVEANRQDYTGTHPESGHRIDYLRDSTRTIYWDDNGSLMVGDVSSETLSPQELAQVWTKYVM